MSNQNPKGKQASGNMDYDLDILNDSIPMNLVDDSFGYSNDSTFTLPTKQAGPSSSGEPKSIASTNEESCFQPMEKSRASTPQQNLNLQPSGEASHHEEEKFDNRHYSSPPQTVDRNLALEKERDWLRGINKLLSKSADELDQVREKLERVQSATQTSNELLDLYSKIVAQTEHTQDLLKNPDWKGSTEDMKRRAQMKEEERIKLVIQKASQDAEARIKQREEEEESERQLLRQILSSNNRPSSSIPTRGRGAGNRAGRTVRGISRIGRIK